MIQQFRLFLGPGRVQALILLLGITGLVSLMLNAIDRVSQPWVTTAQSLSVLVFAVGAAVIIGGRLDHDARVRWVSILTPAAGAIILGLTVLPQFLLPLAGAGLGWVIAGAFVFRPRVPREMQTAIKHLRQGEYEDAVKAMNSLIKADPDNENYYRLRAEVLRLWGKLDRARRDYAEMIRLAPESAVAHNGLAEVLLQSGTYDEARAEGLRAYELAPEDWVAAYNLGMIEDRLQESTQVIEHLGQALRLRVPDARHRLLIHLYLARAYRRLDDEENVRREIELLKRERGGLEEWESLLKHEQAAPLRDVLAADVEMAQGLIAGSEELNP